MLQTGEQNGSINRVIGLKSDPWFRWSIQRSEFPGDEIEMLVLETVVLSGRKNAGGKANQGDCAFIAATDTRFFQVLAPIGWQVATLTPSTITIARLTGVATLG